LLPPDFQSKRRSHLGENSPETGNKVAVFGQANSWWYNKKGNG